MPCAETPANEVLGTVVYSGPWDPEYDDADRSKPPHQNFTVTVPAEFTSGQVSLGVVHLSVVGVSVSPP